jgi:phosphate transport system substrate-binding protein
MSLTKRIVVAMVSLMLCATAALLAADPIAITGAGATFPYPVYSKWFDVYKNAHPNIEINYQSQGSGAGIRQVTDGTVDFGASDGPMNDTQIQDFKSKRGTNILHFPTVLGADVLTYNIPGLSAELKFTPDAIAGIFLGKITKWNDPAIAGANPGVKLPNEDIIVVHRSDGSGTTYIWTDYLCKISKEWETKVGRGPSPNWPVGLGQKGNEGVTGLVKQTPNSVGYIELIYAIQNNLPSAPVQNMSGSFVKPSLASVSAAAAGATIPEDFRVSITNPPGNSAYPIASFTWLLVPAQISDASKRDAIKGFLKWMLADGQKLAEPLAYAPLPKEVVARELKAIDLIK